MKDVTFCMKCFWAYPEKYDHVAGNFQKIISIVFTGDEVADYEKLIEYGGEEKAEDIIKKLIHDYLK